MYTSLQLFILYKTWKNKIREKRKQQQRKQANRKENNTIQARSDQTESQRQYVDQIIRNCRSRIIFFYNTTIVCLPFPRKSRLSFSSKRLLSKKPSVSLCRCLSVGLSSVRKDSVFSRMCVMGSPSLFLSLSLSLSLSLIIIVIIIDAVFVLMLPSVRIFDCECLGY